MEQNWKKDSNTIASNILQNKPNRPCFIIVSLPRCWENCSYLWVELCSIRSFPPHLYSSSTLPAVFPPGLVTLQLLPIQNQRSEPAGTLQHRITGCITSVREKLKPPSHLVQARRRWSLPCVREWRGFWKKLVAQVAVGHQPRLCDCWWSTPIR